MTSRTFRTVLGIALVCMATSCDSLMAPQPNTSSGLRVWAEVLPAHLSIADTTARIRLRIYVENPSGESISIASGGPPYVFASDPARSQGLEESFRIASATSPLNAGPNTDYWGQPAYTFAPHETEYTEAILGVRDWAAGGWALHPGPLKVRSYYNGREGAGAIFRVVP